MTTKGSMAMPDWASEEVERLRRRYVGSDEDFDKLLHYLAVAWTRADLEAFLRSERSVAWDDYFRREKLLRGAERPKE